MMIVELVKLNKKSGFQYIRKKDVSVGTESKSE